MEKNVRPLFHILDFKFPAFFIIVVSSIMRLNWWASYLIKAELFTARAHTLARSHGAKRETADARLPAEKKRETADASLPAEAMRARRTLLTQP